MGDLPILLALLFELRSSNNGGSPLTLVSILPSINRSEKSNKKNALVHHPDGEKEMIAN
jgi:hypothetical protein